MILRDINFLNPVVKEKTLQLLDLAKKNWLNVWVFETLRSKERSLELSKVWTWTVYSYHNFGIAVDLVFIDSLWQWTWSTLPKYNWKLLGELWENIGFEWWGRWKNIVDMPHFQYTFGKSIADIMKEWFQQWQVYNTIENNMKKYWDWWNSIQLFPATLSKEPYFTKDETIILLNNLTKQNEKTYTKKQ